ncbi:hypothetical protein ACTXT7_010792 [Hymenolepis weldensis]
MFIPPGNDNDTLLADELTKKVRVYALILTMPTSKLTRAVHVKATWARRFNGYVFISSEDDPSLPSIRAVETESREILWEKTRKAFIYAKKNFLNDYDFFMKADDDSYVIVENLRFILSKMDPNVPFIMGRRFKKYIKQGYLSGGAGYVVSRAALKMIAEGMEKEVPDCQKRGGAEDVNLGACAERVGVKMIDSLDEHGEEAFHPFTPEYMLDKAAMDRTKWVHSYNYYPIKTTTTPFDSMWCIRCSGNPREVVLKMKTPSEIFQGYLKSEKCSIMVQRDYFSIISKFKLQHPRFLNDGPCLLCLELTVLTGFDCCSDHSVSFHYVSPKDMYLLDYLIYHLYPYGIARDLEQYKELERLKQNKSLTVEPSTIAGKPVPNKS